MNITIPDLHIGRCHNLRASRYHIGQYLRCLDYEATPHVCVFEGEVAPHAVAGIYSVSPPIPKPWVKPVIGS